jgi:hypothetical protein
VALTPQGAKRTGLLVDRDGALTWVKRVNSALHMLRLPEPSWAFDEAKLLEAEGDGVKRIEVHDEAGNVWWSSLAYVLERGQVFDRGCGRQVRLPLNQWSFLPGGNAGQLRLPEAIP